MKQLILLFLLFQIACKPIAPDATDPTAEMMIHYQRSNGGWPQYNGDPTNYDLPLTDSLKAVLLADKNRLDATMDDRSTTGEIKYLLTVFDKTKNAAYLESAERGIAYLLKAQNAAGGWPQSYPDTSGYHSHITFNDNAMVDVMRIIKGTSEGMGIYQPVNSNLKKQSEMALSKGIDCILATQVRHEGKLTVWCAQHDNQTLLPAPARAFEPPSLSGAESVGIVRFLMGIEPPSDRIITAVNAAVKWFEENKIAGWDIEVRKDNSQRTGYDRVIFKDENSTIWARFYKLETYRPIFAGRDGIIHYSLDSIENERRVGYAFYGKWPADLLEKDYPAWKEKWGE